MVMQSDERQRPDTLFSPQAARGGPVVAFDFDGTLTTRDSFTDFLRWRDGTFSYGLGLARLVPAALRWVGNRDRGQIKAAAVRTFLRGMPRALLEQEAHEFATLTAREREVLERPRRLGDERVHDGLRELRNDRAHRRDAVVETTHRRLHAVVRGGVRLLSRHFLLPQRLLHALQRRDVAKDELLAYGPRRRGRSFGRGR